MQDRAVALLEEHKNLMCMWATGVGKSNVALKFLKRHSNMTTLILVPERDNIKNWQAEFKKFDVSVDNVTIACYASLHKFHDSEYDLLILDEAPHINTEKRYDLLSDICAEYVLALGAYMTYEQMDTLKDLYGDFYVYRVGLDDAISKNILPMPHVAVVHMDLDSSSPKFWQDGALLSERGVYNAIERKIEVAKFELERNPSEWNRIKLNQLGSERKRFLGSMKDEAIQRLCNKMDQQGRRYLCFCSSIEQAEKLGGGRTYTSKTPASAKLLERFNSGEINALFVVGKLIEGQNLNNIHCGVLGQLGNSNRITIQSIGRIMRSDKPIVFVTVFDNTKDESFLNTVINNIPDDYIKHYKFK